MSYYFVAQIRIKNDVEYQKYINSAGEIFKKYNGEYIAIDDKPQVLEGNWNYTRIVMIRFVTKDDFSEWYDSEDYQKILKYRLKASDCDTILLKGLD